MKKYIKITTFLSYLLISLFGVVACLFTFDEVNYIDLELNHQSNKLILFIGDGMGLNHLKVWENYYQKELYFTSYDVQGEVETKSLTKFAPTDSAASATALATGFKTFNRMVGMKDNHELLTICDYFFERGYGTGVVTTDLLSGATPAGFSAHALDRSDEKDIIKSQIKGTLNLLLGKGTNNYYQQASAFESNGYTFINNLQSITNQPKIIGAFNDTHSLVGLDTEPTIYDLTKCALTYMEENFPQGYFLMIEAAHIDKMSHDNNMFAMLDYLTNFNDAIYYAHTSVDDLTIIVTADHETGSLEIEDEIGDHNFKKSSHTSRNVGYFIHTSDEIKTELNTILPKEIDNTMIYQIIKALIS